METISKKKYQKAKESIQVKRIKNYKLHNKMFWKFRPNQRLEETYTGARKKKNKSSAKILTKFQWNRIYQRKRNHG